MDGKKRLSLPNSKRKTKELQIKDDDREAEILAHNELDIQANRILNILDKAIEQLELVIKLPLLLVNEGQSIQSYLKPSEVDYIVAVFAKCSKCIVSNKTEGDWKSISNLVEKINLFENPKLKKKTYNYQDFFMSQALHLVFECKPLVKYIKEYPFKSDAEIVYFMSQIERLKEIVKNKLSVTAKEELERENEIRFAYKTNLILNSLLREICEAITKQKAEYQEEVSDKLEKIEQLRQKIIDMKENFASDLKDVMLKSEKDMMVTSTTSEAKQAELQSEAKETTKNYESLLEEHLASEKSLRQKKFKIETQLASWLTKYDTDIGDRQTELENLQDIYDAEKAEYDALQDEFDEQEKLYIVLMEEKEEEEQRIFEEKAYEFLLNRSARRIQRAWRAYKERKARRRARRGKKKGGEGGGRKKKGGSKKKSEGSKKVEKKGGKKKKKKQEEDLGTIKVGNVEIKKRGKYKKVRDEKLTFDGPDAGEILAGTFNKETFQDLNTDNEAFTRTDVKVNLDG